MIIIIYLTGDTHIPIDIRKLNTRNFPEQKNLTRDDYVIILGDFGLYWHKDKTYQYWRKWLQDKPFTTLWIDGNHENHDWTNSMPVSTWHGGKVHRDGNIIHLMRGQIFDINGKKFLTIGGAASIDKDYRTEGLSWWPQEVLSTQDIDECCKNLKKVDNKVDYVLTHTCPWRLIDPMFHIYEPHGNLSTEYELQAISQDIEYKAWFFGHWHKDIDYRARFFSYWHKGRDHHKFHCLYNRIVNLDTFC